LAAVSFLPRDAIAERTATLLCYVFSWNVIIKRFKTPLHVIS